MRQRYIFWVHRGGNPWVRWESAVSSNEQRTLRLDTSLLLNTTTKEGMKDEEQPLHSENTYKHITVPSYFICPWKTDSLEYIHFLMRLFLLPSHLFCICVSVIHTLLVLAGIFPMLARTYQAHWLPLFVYQCCCVFFPCMGWQISPLEDRATYVISKTSSSQWKDTRKTWDRELQKGPSVTTAFLRASFHPLPGLRSVPAASAWRPPSEHSRGAMSHGLTPSQILTVWLQPRKWSRMVPSEAKMTSQQAWEWAIAG